MTSVRTLMRSMPPFPFPPTLRARDTSSDAYAGEIVPLIAINTVIIVYELALG
jgi:hypothetical protein